jgi:hypothetical protein
MNPFCNPFQSQQPQSEGCFTRLQGLQRLSDPFVANVITTVPTLAGEAGFTLSPLTEGAIEATELGEASKWLGKILRQLGQTQIQADIYGGHAQLLLDAPGNYWEPIDSAFEDVGLSTSVRGLAQEGDYFVDPTLGESTAIHGSRVLSVPSRAWVVEGQDVMNARALGSVAGLQRSAGFNITWSASSVLDGFWAWWNPFRESSHELMELMRRKDFLLLSEENLKRNLDDANPEAYLKPILEVAKRAIRDEGIFLTDAERKAVFVTRNLTGVPEIHEAIRVAAIGASGLTEATLFNFTLTGGGLASVDLRDRLSIQSAVMKVLTRWEQQLEPLLASVGMSIAWEAPLYLTPMEIATLYGQYATADQTYVTMGAITAAEARTRLEGGWTQGLTLDKAVAGLGLGGVSAATPPEADVQEALVDQPIG